MHFFNLCCQFSCYRIEMNLTEKKLKSHPVDGLTLSYTSDVSLLGVEGN
jgi:hypothetical protein